MRPGLSVAACVAMVVALGGAARADQNLNCDAYAAKAVQQQQENQSLACGFGGGAWSADTAGHRSWCLLPQVEMANLVQEDNARAAALAACRQQDIACGQYALLAREQNQMAQGCGFSGGRWSNDVNGHRAWCMTASPDAVEVETVARNAAIAQCSAGLADINLQDKQQKMNQILQMMQNISKAMHDSQMAIIRKIGG